MSTNRIISRVVLLLAIINATSVAQRKPLHISVREIADGFFVHTSYAYLDGRAFPSNGLFVSTSRGTLLVDTGWDEPQTEQILSWVDSVLGQPIILCIVTHFHSDRLGGAGILYKHEIPIVSTALTARLAPEPEKGFLQGIA